MSDFLRFMLIAGPAGLFTYIIGWWRGYRTAIHEWNEPVKRSGVQVIQTAGLPDGYIPPSASLAPPAPAPDTSSYKMEQIREGWPRHL